jgi:hypothetical protein
MVPDAPDCWVWAGRGGRPYRQPHDLGTPAEGRRIWNGKPDPEPLKEEAD